MDDNECDNKVEIFTIKRNNCDKKDLMNVFCRNPTPKIQKRK